MNYGISTDYSENPGRTRVQGRSVRGSAALVILGVYFCVLHVTVAWLKLNL